MQVVLATFSIQIILKLTYKNQPAGGWNHFDPASANSTY